MDANQRLALYVRYGAGACRVQVDGYTIYNKQRKGHSYSGNLNVWVREGCQELVVTVRPDAQGFDVVSPEVELQLLQDGRCDALIGPTGALKPEKTEVVRRLDQSVEELVLIYSLTLALPPFGNWLNYPQPWGLSLEDPDFVAACDIYKAIEGHICAGRLSALGSLAAVRIGFVSRRLQSEESDLNSRFLRDAAALGKDPSLIVRSEAPNLQMRFIPVKLGVLYRMERIEGHAAIYTKPDETGMQQGLALHFGKNRDGVFWVL